MKGILEQSDYRLSNTPNRFTRYLYGEINWNRRLIGIRGGKGTGKTTLLLQYLLNTGKGAPASVWASLDDLYFKNHDLQDTVKQFVRDGCTTLILDEVHKYPNWADSVAQIHLHHPNLQILFAGSSIITTDHLKHIPGRSPELYDLPGLSYREYLRYAHDLHFDALNITDLIQESQADKSAFPSDFRPLRFFEDYLTEGYYPFHRNDFLAYRTRLEKSVRHTIESDLAELQGFDVRNAHKLLHLLTVIAELAPFKPNISKLAEQCDIHRNSLVPYLQYLEKARYIRLLYPETAEISPLQKPARIYLNNTNLASAFGISSQGNHALRETFLLTHLSERHSVRLSSSGDFIADKQSVFNTGRQDDPNRKIGGLDPVYLRNQEASTNQAHRVPIWKAGLLY